ncbi:MAG: hypothetical protein P9X24_07095 [Candidatus Hatepunaea meridiana]|nr:hypothetical protein [Candidatus Hatepunaea meridiana]
MAYETDLIEFTLIAQDNVDLNDELTIEMIELGGLPGAISFNDDGHGTAVFICETDYEDAGLYDPSFTVSDGEETVEFDVVIVISDRDRAPEIIRDIPDVEIDEDSELLVIADLDTVFNDPDGDEMTFTVDGMQELNLNINEDNVLTLIPAEDFCGEDIDVFVFADDGRVNMRDMVVVSECCSVEVSGRRDIVNDITDTNPVKTSKLRQVLTLRHLDTPTLQHLAVIF